MRIHQFLLFLRVMTVIGITVHMSNNVRAQIHVGCKYMYYKNIIYDQINELTVTAGVIVMAAVRTTVAVLVTVTIEAMGA
jgi:hypothetical protein